MRIAVWFGICLCLVTSALAKAADPCDGVDQQLTAARRMQYAPFIVKAVRTPHTAKDATITHFMQSGNWSAVWAETKDFEPGVFFFEESRQQQRFVKVWGGWAVPGDRPHLVDWAHGLGKSVSDNLASCFAEEVTAGH